MMAWAELGLSPTYRAAALASLSPKRFLVEAVMLPTTSPTTAPTMSRTIIPKLMVSSFASCEDFVPRLSNWRGRLVVLLRPADPNGRRTARRSGRDITPNRTKKSSPRHRRDLAEPLERWTGFEPATFSLARRRSTAELPPRYPEL